MSAEDPQLPFAPRAQRGLHSQPGTARRCLKTDKVEKGPLSTGGVNGLWRGEVATEASGGDFIAMEEFVSQDELLWVADGCPDLNRDFASIPN